MSLVGVKFMCVSSCDECFVYELCLRSRHHHKPKYVLEDSKWGLYICVLCKLWNGIEKLGSPQKLEQRVLLVVSFIVLDLVSFLYEGFWKMG